MSGAMASDMFGIKLIYPDHLSPLFPYFSRAMGDDRPPLMNFGNDAAGRALAARLPVGHRCLVYVTGVQLFVWAIEFTGTVADGEAARRRHEIGPHAHGKFSVYRPIRFVARAEPYELHAGRLRDVCDRSGVAFAPSQGDSHLPLTPVEYARMYRAINWTWEAE